MKWMWTLQYPNAGKPFHCDMADIQEDFIAITCHESFKSHVAMEGTYSVLDLRFSQW
jgi:hypothetical protein